jgi:predicted nucleotidyltransferase component of viral defense system
MEIIPLNELKVIAGEKGFGIEILEKDYLVTYLLYLLKDIEGIYFKGGTALNKIFLNHARLSEDLDYTITKDVKIIEKQVKDALKGTIFNEITHDKRVFLLKKKITRFTPHLKISCSG